MAVTILHLIARYWQGAVNQESAMIDWVAPPHMIGIMKGQVTLKALMFGLAAGALLLTSCATTEARISKHPEIYQRLSARDQALVSQGQIRPGMTIDAVWLAWGSPDQKIPGERRGRLTETWMYVRYDTPYPSYGAPYYYGPFDWSYIPPKFPYLSKGVTFSNGRVVFFQRMPPPPP
jgi:hypothetical protein